MEVNYTDEPDLPLSQRAHSPPEEAHWDELQEYVGSSDDERMSQDDLRNPPQDGFRDGLLDRLQVCLPERPQDRSQSHPQDHPQQMLEVRSCQWTGLERFASVITEPSVSTYDDDDDVQRWHYFVSESHGDWDEVQVIALMASMVLVCFVGAVMVWVMIT